MLPIIGGVVPHFSRSGVSKSTVTQLFVTYDSLKIFLFQRIVLFLEFDIDIILNIIYKKDYYDINRLYELMVELKVFSLGQIWIHIIKANNK